jgi:hypothetical protein
VFSSTILPQRVFTNIFVSFSPLPSFSYNSHLTSARIKSAIEVSLSQRLMQLLDGPVSSNALSQVDMQSSKFPIHQIRSSILQKSKSLLQTTALHELQWVQPKSEAPFALALDMDKFAALFVYLVGSLFLVACLLPVEVMHGMMFHLSALLLAHCLLLLLLSNSASRHLLLRTLTSQAHLTASTLPNFPGSNLLFQLTIHRKAVHGSNSMDTYKHQQSCHALQTCTSFPQVRSSIATIKASQFLAQLPHRLVQEWFSAPLMMQTS